MIFSRIALLGAAALLPIAAPGLAAPTSPAVAIKNFAFVPNVITVEPGTTVVWTNVDDDPHTVTANDKTFHSAAMDTSDTFRYTFTKPGEYAYFCSLHPHMTGKVIVKGH